MYNNANHHIKSSDVEVVDLAACRCRALIKDLVLKTHRAGCVLIGMYFWWRVSVTYVPRTPQQAEAAVALPSFPPAVVSVPPAVEPAAPLAGTKSKEPTGTAQADSLNLPTPEPESQPEPELTQAPTHDPHQSLTPSPHPKVPPVASP